jgi:uncharacterized transporter YbjL
MTERPPSQRGPGQPEGGLTMTLLRLWLWVVPIGLIIAAAVFGVVAFTGERWALFGVMVVIGVFAIALLVLHWWVMYRFGREPRR